MSLKVSDDYLIGFVEGEGMFYVGIVPSRGTSRNKSGWQVIYFFKVSQNPTGRLILEQLKARLGCGYIKENSKTDFSDKSLAYVVRDFESIKEKVIPFFRDRLIIKRDSFEKFERIISLVSQKEHLTYQGMKKILDLAYSMNTQKRRVSKQEILKTYN
ncbi:MAG: LAGLIDADG family homing endonuclease [Patescibacteria group bacterium]